MLVWNMLLALAWAALGGSFSLLSLGLGFALGYCLLALMGLGGVGPARTYALRFIRAVSFLGFFLWELILSNIRVAYDVLTPRHHMRPGVIAIPLDARTDTEITLLASFITLTPGTLSLDVSTDRSTLYIHAMYIDRGGADAMRRSIKKGLERRLLEVLR